MSFTPSITGHRGRDRRDLCSLPAKDGHQFHVGNPVGQVGFGGVYLRRHEILAGGKLGSQLRGAFQGLRLCLDQLSHQLERSGALFIVPKGQCGPSVNRAGTAGRPSYPLNPA
jgi:hypothetical protein